MKLIDKDAVLVEIAKQRQLIYPRNTGEMRIVDIPKPLEQGWLNALKWTEGVVNSLEVKEVDLKDEASIRDELLKCLGGSYSSRDFAVAKHFYTLGLEQKGK